jgi:RimJ/RimL family protein N-acetyltransferase
LRTLVFETGREIRDWVIERIPESGPGCFADDSAIGVMSGDRMIAGVVYHDYKPQFGTIELSMAADSPMWASHDIIAGLLHFPFRQLKVFKVFTVTPADNVAALRVNEHIGFKREAILAHQFGRKRHAVIMRMLEPDYARIYRL